MTSNQLMTGAAVGLAVLAVLYAFKRPSQPAVNARTAAVTDWGRVWDEQMAGLQLSANVGGYNDLLLSRGFGFTV